MRDPGYIPERGWNHEEWFLRRQRDVVSRDAGRPYADRDHYDQMVGDIIDEADETGERDVLTPRSEWLHNAISDRLRWEREDFKRQGAADRARMDAGVVPGIAVRGAASPLTPAGVSSPAGSTL